MQQSSHLNLLLKTVHNLMQHRFYQLIVLTKWIQFFFLLNKDFVGLLTIFTCVLAMQV